MAIYKVLFEKLYTILTLLKMDLLGTAHGLGGGAKGPPFKNLSYISYNDHTSHSFSYLKKTPKIYLSRDTPLEFW